ncbi:large conductance mechanosensitive channel protein MscL [Bombilactobacillus folatiphilus]|uniref:Large-conductance mechanosensitive channel n=1 Tax=Bombilactobacillus folatiphilus TaxID=2923362 RepID=A0ABY4P991_9LACO|nr:large conductance mechanosensitive channel protein MscL [Bombilactobacillus folatiphilus]UQS82310.1 large conductance mechanosensitive channel protein MscL [Bombilactobacillus folatiphilus]
MWQEFKDFISHGNVVDLAIGVIIGGAFQNIVGALTKYILNPFIGLFLGRIDLSQIKLGMFRIGDFLNSIIEFLIIAVVVFFIVKALNVIKKPQVEDTPTPSNEELSVQYLADIKDLLQKQIKH